MNTRRASWQPNSLPAELMQELRSIFEKLDTTGNGYVPIDWIINSCRQSLKVPAINDRDKQSFLVCLRRCAPPNGMITWERICTAVRLTFNQEKTSSVQSSTSTLNGSANAPNGRVPLYSKNSNSNTSRQNHAHQSATGSNGDDLVRLAAPKRTNSEPSIARPRPHSQYMSQATYVSLKSQLHHNAHNGTYENLDAVQPNRNNDEKISNNNNYIKNNNNNKMKNNIITNGNINGHHYNQPPHHRLPKIPSKWSPNGQHLSASQMSKSSSMSGVSSSQTTRAPSESTYRPLSTTSCSTNNESSSISPASAAHDSGYTNSTPSPSQVVVTMRDKTTRRIYAKPTVSTSNNHQHPQTVDSTRRHTYSEHMHNGNHRQSSQSSELNSQHTGITNGNVPAIPLKHNSILDEEESILSRGLDVASKLTNWYSQRKDNLNMRRKLMAKGMVPLETAVHEERLNYLRAHVAELNRRSCALIESSDRSFPSHGNLAHAYMPQHVDDQIDWLKHQNKLLSDELADKTSECDHLRDAMHRRYTPTNNNNSPTASRTNGHATNGRTPIQQTPQRHAVVADGTVTQHVARSHYAPLPVIRHSTVTPAIQATLI